MECVCVCVLFVIVEHAAFIHARHKQLVNICA